MDNSMGREYLYDVFLSYRHKPLDSMICKKLHTLLETYKPVRRFRFARIGRVFRDDEELPAAGILSDTIAQALVSSGCLVVVCSPDTPESEWVDREVRTFIELGRSDRIFALLISGTPEQSFPPSLKRVRGIESRTLSVVAAGERHIIRNLKREMLRIIAAVSGVSWDQFRVSERRRGIRRLVFTAAVLVTLFFASGLWLLRQWLMASQYGLYAENEEILVHTVIQNMTKSLQERLMDIPEAVPLVAEILEENLIYLKDLAELDGGLTRAEGYLRSGYIQAIDAWVDLGDFSRVAKYADRAVKEYERLAADGSYPGARKDLFICYSLAGTCMKQAGNPDKAIYYFSRGVSLGRELDEQDPDVEIRRQIAMNLVDMGDCYIAGGSPEDAVSCYDDAVEICMELADSGELIERDLAGILYGIASTLHDTGYYDGALKYYQQQKSFLESLVEAGAKTDDVLLHDLAVCYANQGIILFQLGDNRQAASILEKAAEIFDSLPPYPETDYNHAIALSFMGRAYQNMEIYLQARASLARSISILEKHANDPGSLHVRIALADNYRFMAINSKLISLTDSAVSWYEKAIALYDWLVSDMNDYSRLWDLAVSLQELGAIHFDTGRYDEAISLLSRAKDVYISYDEAAVSSDAQYNIALCNNDIGLCWYNQGDFTSAIPYLSYAAEHYRTWLEQPDPVKKRLYADCCGYLGRCYAFLGEYEIAMIWHQESALVFEALSKDQPAYLRNYALSLYWAAIDRVLLGNSQAEDYYILCLDRYDTFLENGDRSYMPTYLSLYAFYYLVFDDDYGQALRISRQAWQASPDNAFAKRIYAYSLLLTGHREEAEELLSGLAAGIPTDLALIRLDLEVFKAVGFSGHELEPISRLFGN